MTESATVLAVFVAAALLHCHWQLLTAVLGVTPREVWAALAKWFRSTTVGQRVDEYRAKELGAQMRAVWAAPVVRVKVRK